MYLELCLPRAIVEQRRTKKEQLHTIAVKMRSQLSITLLINYSLFLRCPGSVLQLIINSQISSNS